MNLWHTIVKEDLNKEGWEPPSKLSQTYRYAFAKALNSYKYTEFLPADKFAHDCAVLADAEETLQYYIMKDATWMNTHQKVFGPY